MRGHPGSETIAAFREGLLPARRAVRTAAHLAECPRCAEVDAQLAAVTAALARTPTPPMPASLTARLDAALAAEVAARSAAGASPGHADSAEGAAPAGAPDRTAPPDRRSPADRAASPAGHGPGTGQGTPDPGTPDPGTPDPGTPDPGTPDPGTPDPGTPDPGAALAAHGPGRGCRSASRRLRPPWSSWRAAGTRSRGWSRGVRRRRRPVPPAPPLPAARLAGHPGQRWPPRPDRALPPPQGSRWSPAARRTGRASCRPR